MRLLTLPSWLLACGTLTLVASENTMPSTHSVPATASHDYPIQPVPFTAVQLTCGVWLQRQEVNRTVTMPYALDQCVGRMRNFDLAAETMARRAAGEATFQNTPIGEYPFDDTDPYKAIEGASFALAQRWDPALDDRIDGLIARIAAAQEPDGYLYTFRTMHPDAPAHPWVGATRWEKDPELSHELYNLGHLFEAGTAHWQATGKRTLLDVCLRSAELVHRDFLVSGLRIAPGHQVIEVGLAKLYRVTGDRRWINLARYFLDIRGPGGNPYSQAHLRVVEQTTAVGHAVRAGYQYAGMADVAALCGDPRYAEASKAIWRDMVTTKLHLTGGIGARYEGEAFGEAFELPHKAYNETCAAIANLMWNHRLFLLTGDAAYLDVFERTLHNGFPSGVSISGDRFFYPNNLVCDGRGTDGVRQPWFGCACCPPNVLRTLAALTGYLLAVRDDELFIAQYAASRGTVTVAGTSVTVEQATDYPADGRIRLTITPAQAATFTLKLRLPGWVQGRPLPSELYTYEDPAPAPWSLRVAGETMASAASPALLDQGWLVLHRTWQPGTVVELDLPMPVRRVVGDPRIAATRDQVAIERGPLVFAAEGLDQDRSHLRSVWVPGNASAVLVQRPHLLGGVPTIDLAGCGRRSLADQAAVIATTLHLIPYAAWANRSTTPMQVWFPRNADGARPEGQPTIASRATASSSVAGKPLGCISDPEADADDPRPAHADWWPNLGTEEWVQYDFAEPTTVHSVAVRWWDDAPYGGSRVPVSWRLLQRTADGSWAEISAPAGDPGVQATGLNRREFPAITTTALRIEAQLQPGKSGGVVLWRVE